MIQIGHIDGVALTQDNNFVFFDSLRAFLGHADGELSFSMYQKEDVITVHIKPSNVSFKQDIIDSLLAFRRIMNIKIIFSKSLKISDTISFSTIFVS